VPYPGEIPLNLCPPLRTGAYRHGTVFALRVEVGGKVLVHVGSAHLPPGPVGRDVPRCDALFICVSGWRRVPGFVPRLLDAFQPQVVVPFHWDDFTAPLRDHRPVRRVPFVDVEGFVERVSRHAPQAEVRRLEVLEEMVLGEVKGGTEPPP
jgi:hypothetical protein